MLGLGLGLQKSRFIAGGYDVDYQAWLDYLATQGDTPPSDDVKALQNAWVIGAKAGGYFSKLKLVQFYATDGDRDAAATSLVLNSASYVKATELSSPTFTANEGFTGDGAASYLDSGLDPSSAVGVTQNSISFFGYIYSGGTTNNVLCGRNFGPNDIQIVPYRAASGAGLANCNDNTANNPWGAIDPTNTGFFGESRTSGSEYITIRPDGTVQTSVVASNLGVPSFNIFVLRTDVAAAYGDNTVGLYGMGTGLTQSELENLKALTDTYFTNLAAL